MLVVENARPLPSDHRELSTAPDPDEAPPFPSAGRRAARRRVFSRMRTTAYKRRFYPRLGRKYRGTSPSKARRPFSTRCAHQRLMGREAAPSGSHYFARTVRLPETAIFPLYFLFGNHLTAYQIIKTMSGRQLLSHQTPDWVDLSSDAWFVTIRCQERGRNQLARPGIGEAILHSVAYRYELRLWHPHLFLLMPDHAMALSLFQAACLPPRLFAIGNTG